ncbi:hypothetical protein GVO57_03930 [Sphingomonas changnyeongensis]|uniref:Uncharacterized protein n=1 Tax=Sphingomonas changnyeongensis TaxID=2698679 RepID=A0A7Z2NUP2_9SPHN|nr:hypothetical protein [Sphingomonas changnyeongensis]QHL90141.1 hypothetical protein GVO57_03930 [Sphingomonas changnyeongensis]
MFGRGQGAVRHPRGDTNGASGAIGDSDCYRLSVGRWLIWGSRALDRPGKGIAAG